jgi:DNA-binding CsgD family transcriptional regulator
VLDWRIFEGVRIDRPVDVRPAAILLRDAIFALSGLHVAPCHDISSRELMCDGDGEILASGVFSAGCPDRWWLDTRLALTSPLAAGSRLTAEPFWCNARGIHGRRPDPLLAAIDLDDFERRAHTRAAIVMPVHMPFGQVGTVSLLPAEGNGDDLSEPFARCADVIALYVRRFLVSYVETMQPRAGAALDPTLRKREVECLRWAALGKTNDEVAIILGLSRATVRFHIHNASERLNAVNRDQTIFKAAQLGYLALRP